MTDSSKKVLPGKVVTFHYTLTNDAGVVLDSSDGRPPLPYLHGAGNIIPGLEQEMAGKAQGECFTAHVNAGDAYGDKVGPGPQPVPRDAFPEDVDLQPGMQFLAEDEQGNQMPLWVTAVDGDQVFVDQNHPLAGENLHFEVEVVGMRDATDEEKDHGHPHHDLGDCEE